MSKLIDIRTAWTNAVWKHDTVQSWTNKIHFFDITEDSQREVSKLTYETDGKMRLHFLTCLVNRTRKEQLCGRIHYEFTVTVRYHLEVDQDGLYYNRVLDRLETLDELVITQLGRRWTNTIDYYDVQAGPFAVNEITLIERPCWRGEYVYTGYQETSVPS